MVSFDINNPIHLLAAWDLAKKAPSWLRDRYFPTNPATDIFNTDNVLIEIRNGERHIAPFVIPEVGGKFITRSGYRAERISPPFMGLKTKLTIDELKKKGFGEAYFANVSPEQRAQALLLRDMEEMEKRFVRTEELLCAKLLTENGYVLKHYGAESDDDVYQSYKISFNEGDDDKTAYVPAANWTVDSKTIVDDIAAMIEQLDDVGMPAEDLIVSPEVANTLIKNTQIRDDIKTFSNYKLAPQGIEVKKLPNGVKEVMKLNVYGTMITVFSYSAKYLNPETGKEEAYIPKGTVVLTAPACGKMLYGAVTQMNAQKQFQTYAQNRVPKLISNEETETRYLRIGSRPVAVPANVNPWVHAKVTA